MTFYFFLIPYDLVKFCVFTMCDVIKRCFIVPVWCYQKMFYGSYHFVWIVFHYYPSRNYQGCFLQLLPLLGKRSYQLNNSFQEDIRTYYDNHMFKSMVFLLWLLENCVVNYVCTYVCMYIFHEHYCSDKHNDIENVYYFDRECRQKINEKRTALNV